MENTFIRAYEVQVGDNVWGHNIVREISACVKHESDFVYVLFNGSGNHGKPWFADENTKVMVTNRTK